MDGPSNLAGFLGTWQLRRTITDRLGPEGRFSGQALFEPVAGGLALREVGRLAMGGQEFAATRQYRWLARGQGVDVQFGDGRFFHHFSLGPRAEAGHDCAPDRYDVAYDFSLWPGAWQATWQVRGPRKDYTMVSRYTREGG